MKIRLIIDGNAVYEIDEECEACMRKPAGSSVGRPLRMSGQTKEDVRPGRKKPQAETEAATESSS
ncbi:MAG: hypothetical protein LUE86_00655 [Clostridiales bacterium]|nr:hypothetical protein [Clostridiales bacterium]